MIILNESYKDTEEKLFRANIEEYKDYLKNHYDLSDEEINKAVIDTISRDTRHKCEDLWMPEDEIKVEISKALKKYHDLFATEK